MRLFKLSAISVLFLWPMISYSFSDMDCLKSNFDTTISHKGSPFGLFDNILTISKKDCDLSITHQKLKYINKSWMIDVCRGPVHLKKTNGAVDVIKKEKSCSGSSFCSEVKIIKTIVQDDGLIFAEGEKENISHDHGKIYCSYLLLRSYLERDIIFSRQKEYVDILELDQAMKKTEATSLERDNKVPKPIVEGVDTQVPQIDQSSEVETNEESEESSSGSF